MIKTHDVFVAYAGPDRDVAVKLIGELHSRRVTVWWDDLLVGRQIHPQCIPEQLSGQRRPVPKHLDLRLMQTRRHAAKLPATTDSSTEPAKRSQHPGNAPTGRHRTYI